jgi:hypothetical protein
MLLQFKYNIIMLLSNKKLQWCSTNNLAFNRQYGCSSSAELLHGLIACCLTWLKCTVTSKPDTMLTQTCICGVLLAITPSTGRFSRQLTYSVYVVLKLSWQVQVDDMGNAFHVQPSTGHISRHQYLQAMHSS